MQQWLNVGKIVNTHGLHGEVTCQTDNGFLKSDISPGNTLYLFRPRTAEPVAVIVKAHRKHKSLELTSISKIREYK